MRLSSFLRSGKRSEVPRIAVMGGLRSGTNLVALLLERYWNVTVDFHRYGWKHAGLPVFAPSSGLAYPDVPIVWVSKHPISFTASLHRYLISTPTGRGISIDGNRDPKAFVRSPIRIWDSQMKGSPQLRFPNPVQYWNFITWNLETLDPARFSVLSYNYEDILSNPATLLGVESLWPLSRRVQGPIALPKTEMGRGKARSIHNTYRYSAATDFMRGDRYVFDEAELDFIRSEADPWLTSRRGYAF